MESSEEKTKFYHFCPIKTYSHPESKFFIQKNGTEFCLSRNRNSSDLNEIFRLGKEIFRRISLLQKNGSFEDFLSTYDMDIQLFREMAIYLHQSKKIVLIGDISGERIENPDWYEMNHAEIINICWNVATSTDWLSDNDFSSLYYSCLLGCALIEVDRTLLNLMMGEGAVESSISAANLLSNAMSIDSNNKSFELSRKNFALSGAIGRLNADPRQKEKSFVFDCWKKWKLDTSRYQSKASFARDMLEKCEHLTSQKKIEDWCRVWERNTSV
ncbi:hypothetical protein FNL37_0866 [Methylovorus glucosotrophus]|uniref:hypothetical protein n=1 Tax=Methylovorus glucosotrophus TaxID=266009 RepID=UPI0013312576|nr:hypothetical protein [Methylovorus glucosotrophus]KAF0843440.1 hypothetical protein FNL37_0866 [Methylovorus glucosotrophus]